MIRKSISATPVKTGIRRARFIISSDAVDAMGEQVVQSGLRLANFLANPIGLFGHDPNQPIGTWHDITTNAGKTTAELRFPPPGTSLKADEVWNLVESGILRAASVGFNPLDVEPMDPARPRGPLRYLSADLCEVSIVSIPANRDATLLGTETKGFIEMPLSKEERMAMAEEVQRRGQRNGSTKAPLPPRESQVRAEGEHAYRVLALQRLAHPTREDNLVRADRVKQRRERLGLADLIDRVP